MSEVAIRVENLFKRYQIGAKKSSSFRETLSNAFRRKTEVEAEATEFWALKDVSFEIKRGEAVGIIGKNGAGKSTLLKVLSRITEPTKGRIEINGRVASLLEVGTGFHPELTGRENIFMNGTILGMTRREIRSKLDEIIDFSGVEKFIDTPVKRYSSGMYVRLAFAVAAHLEPEILIIDEVLAVGDASFQRKCLGKMEEVAGQGRTVIFISHNLSQVQTLCTQGLLLNQGKLAFSGSINSTIAHYVLNGKVEDDIDVKSLPRVGIKSNDFTLLRLKIVPQNGAYIHEGCELTFSLNFATQAPLEELVLGFSITNSLDANLIECRSTSNIPVLNLTQPGYYQAEATLRLNLHAGLYNISLGARCLNGFLEYIPSVTMLEVLPDNQAFEEWNKPSAGILNAESFWRVSNN